MTDPNQACPDENALSEYAEGVLRADAAAIEQHLDVCATCRRLVSDMVHDTTDARDTDDDSRPAGRRPSVGDRIGRYVVERALGSGGMGVVYLARDTELERPVALKLLRSAPNDEDQAELARRLGREARALARLSHPNVVSVYEVGRHDGGVFVAMEFVQGRSLAGWLDTQRSAPEVLDVLFQAGEGLAAVHAAGLVHRDFKPGNVMVGLDGDRIERVRVVDFGLARGATTDATLTAADNGSASQSEDRSTGVGTPAYMSPEQLDGRAPDALSDQYAFCVTAIEALTGRRPARSWRPSGPRPLLAFLRRLGRGLAQEPEDRYPSMVELLADLRGVKVRRRRLRTGAAVTVAAGLGAGLMATLGGDGRQGQGPDDVCGSTGEELAGVWDEERRQRAQQAFAAVDLSFASQAWSATRKHLDAYTEAWLEARAAVCRARNDGSLEEPQAIARQECLDQLRAELVPITDGLMHVDSDLVARAYAAVQGLPPVARCTAPRADPTLSPEERRQRGDLAQTLARARALSRLGKFDEARPLIASVDAGAETLQAPELRAPALLMAGMNDYAAGRHTQAETRLAEAVHQSELARDDETRGWASVGLMSVVGVGLRRISEGHQWRKVAEGAVARLGVEASVALRLRLLNETGRLYSAGGDTVNARKHHEAALTLVRDNLPAGDPRAAATLLNLALTTEPSDEALAQVDEALSMMRSIVGDGHHKLTFYLNARGTLEYGLDRYDDAAATFRETLAIYEKHFGPDYPDNAVALSNLGEVLLAKGDPAAALPALTRAFEIYDAAYGPDDPSTKSTAEAIERAKAALATPP